MLDRVALNLLNIKDNSLSQDKLNELYRDLHSIKGSSYLFGLHPMGQVAHIMESTLDALRGERLTLNERLLWVLERGTDLLRRMLGSCKKNETATLSPADVADSLSVSTKIAEITSESLDRIDPLLFFDEPFFMDEKWEDSLLRQEVQQTLTPIKIEEEKVQEPKKEPTRVMEKEVPSEKIPEIQGATLAQEAPPPGTGSESLRVSVEILENLMNLVGELVLIRNQYIQHANDNKDSEFANLNQRLNYVTAELQEQVMKTRMQRIETVLSKFHRVVRDLSRTMSKKVNFKLVGADTELDKSILEAIKDPLMHIVRNSLDHGLETPEERLQKSKPEEGTVEIKSYHEGGQVIIEISDDGRGLSREKITQKIIEKKLATQDECDRLSDRDIFLYIFAPGFSTADKISSVSGRGVGMDVVKTNVEKIGGVVDLSSQLGRGTVIKLKIPLTLAIIPALIIRSGGERFSIPQVKLIELVRVETEEFHSSQKVEMLQDIPVYRLRGQLLPLVSLNKILGIPSNPSSPGCESIVVLNADSCVFGLIVDDIEDSNDIVIKPLMQFLKDLSIYSGATILGDGNICLTIDVVGLANRAGIHAQSEFLYGFQQDPRSGSHSILTDQCDYLLVDIGASGKYGLPLSLINRLEEFHQEKIELTGDQRVIRYRGSLLPILSISQYLNLKNIKPLGDSPMCSVIVIERAHSLFGLEVESIEDIITASAEIHTGIKDRPGILGNIVIDQKIVVLIDAFKMIDDYLGVEKSQLSQEDKKKIADKRALHRLLLVEDSPFFRKHVGEVLRNFGFQVIVASDGEAGYNALVASQEKISAIVSDIEMPILNGFELAQKVKQNPLYQSIPMAALTSRFKKSDIEHGEKVGFSHYLEKLNADQLITVVDKMIGIN